MTPYYLLFLFSLLASCIDVTDRDKTIVVRKSITILFGYLVFLSFYLFTCCKGNVGTDYLGYFDIYTKVGRLPYSQAKAYIEPVFWVLCHLFNSLGLSFGAFWFFIAFVTLSSTFLFFKKMSPCFFLSLLIYLSGLFIERDFDGIRQGLSIGIAYVAILGYIKGRKKSFWIFFLISIGVHVSSFVFVFVPILSKLKKRKGVFYFSIVIGISFIILRMDFITIVMKFLPQSYIRSRLMLYYNNQFGGVIGLNVGIIVRVIVLLLFFRINPIDINMNEETYNLLLNGFLFSILLFCFFNNIEIIAHRFAYGFREFQIIIIPICFKYYILDKKISKDSKLIFYSVYIFYAFILFSRIINSPKLHKFYEYSFIFSNNNLIK